MQNFNKALRDYIQFNQVLRAETTIRLEKSKFTQHNKVVKFVVDNLIDDFNLEVKDKLFVDLSNYVNRVIIHNSNSLTVSAIASSFLTIDNLIGFFNIESDIKRYIKKHSHHTSNALTERILESFINTYDSNSSNNLSEVLRKFVYQFCNKNKILTFPYSISYKELIKLGVSFIFKTYGDMLNYEDRQDFVENYLNDVFYTRKIHQFKPKDEILQISDTEKREAELKKQFNSFFIIGLKNWLSNNLRIEQREFERSMLDIDKKLDEDDDGSVVTLGDLIADKLSLSVEEQAMYDYCKSIAFEMAESVMDHCLNGKQLAILKERVLDPKITDKVISGKLNISTSFISLYMPSENSSGSRVVNKVLKYIKVQFPNECLEFEIKYLSSLAEYIVEDLLPQIAKQRLENTMINANIMSLLDSSTRKK